MPYAIQHFGVLLLMLHKLAFTKEELFSYSVVTPNVLRRTYKGIFLPTAYLLFPSFAGENIEVEMRCECPQKHFPFKEKCLRSCTDIVNDSDRKEKSYRIHWLQK